MIGFQEQEQDQRKPNKNQVCGEGGELNKMNITTNSSRSIGECKKVLSAIE